MKEVFLAFFVSEPKRFADVSGYAWSQYWLDVNPNGPGKNGGWNHNPENVALYGNIRNSIKAARLWATTGHRSGRLTELKQIS